MDFGKQSPESFVIAAASALRGGVVEVRADSVGGEVIAEVAVPHTGGWECWQTRKADIRKPVTGIHDIYFVFKGRKGCDLFNLDWWRFDKPETGMTVREIESRTIPASTNIPGYEYPRIDTERRAWFRFYAPQANKLQVDCCGKKYDMQKDADGFWTATTDPLVVGFHLSLIHISEPTRH